MAHTSTVTPSSVMPSSQAPQDTPASPALTQPLDAILSTIEEMFARKQSMTKPFLVSLRGHVEQMKSNVIDFLLPLAASRPVRQPSPQPEAAPRSYAAAAAAPRPAPRPTASIIVKHDQRADSAQIVGKVSEMLTASNSDANIVRTSTTAKGDTLLKFRSSDDVSSIADTITAQLGFNARGRPLLQPKMTLSRIPAHVDVENDLRQQLIDLNPWLQEPLANDGELEVLFRYRPKDFYSAVLKMSPNVRNAIQDHANALNLGNRVCPVKDRFHVLRCFKCSTFGHRADNCHATHPTCGYCSDRHETNVCPKKNDSSQFRCTACTNAPDTDAHHPSIDRKCPRYLQEMKKLIRMTNYGDRPPTL